MDLNVLAAKVGTAESAASGAVGGLNANSSAADLTRAQLLMNEYQMVATAVSAILKADNEAKTAPARAIGH
jgi:hypothetical protein